MNNWYREYKTASRIPTDLDVDFSEVKKPYVKNIMDGIKKILTYPNLESIRESVTKHQTKSKTTIVKKQIGSIDKIKVFLVNGNEIKIKYFMDFVEGGNGMVYGVKHDKTQPNYIPEDEMWVDADLDLSSFPYVLLHEAVEMYLMANEDLKYDEAHAKANGVEKTLRTQNYFSKEKE